jgi:hypothetical protein
MKINYGRIHPAEGFETSLATKMDDFATNQFFQRVERQRPRTQLHLPQISFGSSASAD